MDYETVYKMIYDFKLHRLHDLFCLTKNKRLKICYKQIDK